MVSVMADQLATTQARFARTKRSGLIRNLRDDIAKKPQLMLMLLIPVTWLVIFRYVPMYGTLIAFKDFNIRLGILGSPWAGFKHFQSFFTSFRFPILIRNTIALSVYQLLAGFPVPIILALSLNATRNQRWKKTVQLTIYAPHFISTVVLVGILSQFLSPRVGIYGALMRFIGQEPQLLMGQANLFRDIYVISGVWQHSGYGTIIYLAALSTIDPSLYEAAEIDGASRLQRIRHIDLPGIMPTIVILLILNAGRMMQIGFEKAFLMQNQLNLQTSEIIATYVYKVGIAAALPRYSLGAAVGLFNSVINLVLIVTVNRISRQISDVGLW